MTGAPRATQVQLSTLPTSAMSDQNNKTQCVRSVLTGTAGWRERKKKNRQSVQGRREMCDTKSYHLYIETCGVPRTNAERDYSSVGGGRFNFWQPVVAQITLLSLSFQSLTSESVQGVLTHSYAGSAHHLVFVFVPFVAFAKKREKRAHVRA